MQRLLAVWTGLWLMAAVPAMARQPVAPNTVATVASVPAGQPAAQAASVAAIPFKRESGPADSGASGGALAMLLVAALAIGAVLVLRKRFNLAPAIGGGKGLLRVLETQRLGPRTLLSVVEFSGQRYLIAQNEQGVSCLASAPVPDGGQA